MASTALKLALATSAVVGAWLLGYGDGRAAASRIYSEDLLRQHRAQNVTLARMLNDADEKAQAEQARARRHQQRASRQQATADACYARRDFLHKLSTRLINENQVIAVETLAVSNMQKNRCLAKSISDASWSEFVRQLEYKAHWYGRTLVGIDRWFPSSKRCSDCGHTVQKMPLSVREWACPECGSIHDRDVNAARNVLTAGLAGLVCGENVSPVLL